MSTNLYDYCLSRNELEQLIYQWVFNERNRAIARRRILDGIPFEQLAQEFDLSTQQVKTIIHNVKEELIKHI